MANVELEDGKIYIRANDEAIVSQEEVLIRVNGGCIELSLYDLKTLRSFLNLILRDTQ